MTFDTLDEFIRWDNHERVQASAATADANVYAAGGNVDVAEICGGAADTAYLLVRRGFQHGVNFDITAGFNLRSQQTIDSLGTTSRSGSPRYSCSQTPVRA